MRDNEPACLPACPAQSRATAHHYSLPTHRRCAELKDLSHICGDEQVLADIKRCDCAIASLSIRLYSQDLRCLALPAPCTGSQSTLRSSFSTRTLPALHASAVDACSSRSGGRGHTTPRTHALAAEHSLCDLSWPASCLGN